MKYPGNANGRSQPGHQALVRLEPCDGKLSRTVPRGPGAGNRSWLLDSWAKGILAEALDSVCEQRKAKHVLVNGAYTSQMDSINGLLEGKRVGDKFYRTNGDVLQADHNAARNVLARVGDRGISRFTPYKCRTNRRCRNLRPRGCGIHAPGNQSKEQLRSCAPPLGRGNGCRQP